MAISGIGGLTATAKPNGLDIELQWHNNGEYSKIWIQRDEGSGWGKITDTYSGGEESYTDTNVTQNISINYRVAGYDLTAREWTDWSNTSAASCYADTLTETLSLVDTIVDDWTSIDLFSETCTVSDILNEVWACTDDFAETLSLSDFLRDSQTIRTLYAYFLGTSSGDVHQYGSSYYGYAGDAITSRWESKDIDCADQYIELKDYFKTFYGVRLQYVDWDSSTTISIAYSTDGGVTWTDIARSIGSGNEVANTADFHFIVTAHKIRIAVTHSSSDKRFQWTGMELWFLPSGEFFEV